MNECSKFPINIFNLFKSFRIGFDEDLRRTNEKQNETNNNNNHKSNYKL